MHVYFHNYCIVRTNYTYTYACRNIFNTIKMSGNSSLEKYTSHFIERVRKSYEGYYCVRGELEIEQNCNILTPTLMAITAFLSHSPGLLNQGPRGPASAWTWLSFPHILSNRLELPVHRIILFFYVQSVQTVDSQGPLTPTTGFTCYLHWCISSFDSLAGSEVNVQHNAEAVKARLEWHAIRGTYPSC